MPFPGVPCSQSCPITECANGIEMDLIGVTSEPGLLIPGICQNSPHTLRPQMMGTNHTEGACTTELSSRGCSKCRLRLCEKGVHHFDSHKRQSEITAVTHTDLRSSFFLGRKKAGWGQEGQVSQWSASHTGVRTWAWILGSLANQQAPGSVSDSDSKKKKKVENDCEKQQYQLWSPYVHTHTCTSTWTWTHEHIYKEGNWGWGRGRLLFFSHLLRFGFIPLN